MTISRQVRGCHVWLFAAPQIAACQASPSFTISWSLLKLISIELMKPSNHFILCLPLMLSIFPSIRVFSNELALHIRWPEYWSFSFNTSPSNEYSGLISFRIDWSPCSPRDSQESSPASQFKGINSWALSLLYCPTLTSTHDYWESHSFDYMDNIPIYYAGSVHKETNRLSPYLTEFTWGRW